MCTLIGGRVAAATPVCEIRKELAKTRHADFMLLQAEISDFRWEIGVIATQKAAAWYWKLIRAVLVSATRAHPNNPNRLRTWATAGYAAAERQRQQRQAWAILHSLTQAERPFIELRVANRCCIQAHGIYHGEQHVVDISLLSIHAPAGTESPASLAKDG